MNGDVSASCLGTGAIDGAAGLDVDERVAALSAAGDPLDRLSGS
jgi:hypothetical protein